MKVLLVFLLAHSALGRIVKTNSGELEGWEAKSRDGRDYEAFTGIPYAKPPIGPLRLQNPEPVEPWDGVLDATKDGPRCLQGSLFQLTLSAPAFEGQEDCLYLNVYVPKGGKNLPVLLYTHGGAFKMGYPGPRDMADYMMDEDVVLVTLTYRLGALGFLSFEDKIMPGNFGLKDQAMAIKWTSENVGSFGGDPSRITVFGESAGGASSHFHLFSPLSRDLIKGVISQSGVVNKNWGLSPRAGLMAERALKVAEKVGCANECPKMSLNCLQEVDPTKLIDAEKMFTYWDIDDVIPLRPVVEVNIAGAFLTSDPYTMKSTKPWITGFVTGEGLLKSIPLHVQPKHLMEEFRTRFDEIKAKQLSLEMGDPHTKVVIDKIKQKYFTNDEVSSLIESEGNFFADAAFKFPALKSIQKHRGPAFLYSLEYRGEGTLFDLFFKANTSVPCHGDDLFLLFNQKTRYNLKGTPEDEKVSKAVVKLWANFAAHQNPTPPGSELEWPQYDKKTRKFLRIGETGEISVGENEWSDLYAFWNDLMKIKPKKEEL